MILVSKIGSMTYNRFSQATSLSTATLWSEVDMSIRAEARSPSPPSPKNYRAWASLYKPKKNWAFRAKPIWALGILGLSPFGLGPVQKPEIYILA